jgi:hypothetical protein
MGQVVPLGENMQPGGKLGAQAQNRLVFAASPCLFEAAQGMIWHRVAPRD